MWGDSSYIKDDSDKFDENQYRFVWENIDSNFCGVGTVKAVASTNWPAVQTISICISVLK